MSLVVNAGLYAWSGDNGINRGVQCAIVRIKYVKPVRVYFYNNNTMCSIFTALHIYRYLIAVDCVRGGCVFAHMCINTFHLAAAAVA